LSGVHTPPLSRHILGMRVDATSYDDAAERIVHWARAGESRYVCVAAVNNVMIAREDRSFLAAMNGADLVTSDGMPLVWGLRALGIRDAMRVYGPELTPVVLKLAAREGISVAFVGGAPKILDTLVEKVTADLPGLRVACRVSPPFGPVDPHVEDRIAREINASGARIVFVGLGCPKQEAWMARQRGTVHGVMIGVGAAFDFLAGAKRQAPNVLRRMGLEWLFRLATEPGRLWKRYLHQNPRFVVLFGRQLVRARVMGKNPDGPIERQEAA
jgi:N-acetylglucosaminyldiphosphoundecaprenol N-acetyl-beta-D-mannosaminyltransferase